MALDERFAPAADAAPPTELTDDQRINAYADWIRNNQDKAGSPEYVKVTDAYRSLRAPQVQAPPDPYSTGNTIGRLATGAGTSMVDLAGGAINAVAGLAERAGIATPTEPNTIEVSPGVTKTFTGRVPSLAEGVRSKLGIAELPPDASGVRRATEAGLTGLVTGGRSLLSGITSAPTAAAALTNTGRNVLTNAVLPTVGGEVGGAAGEKIIGGPEGRFIGSVVGGAGGSVLPRAAVAATERYYGTQARPGADAIAAQAATEGITPTAGMLGNEKIQNAERAIAGRGTGFFNNPVVDARERTLVQMRDRADQAAATRGAQHPQPTPGTIGEHVLDTAEQTAQTLRARSSAGQQALFDRVGESAPVDVGPVYSTLRAEIARTDPITARPMQQRLDALQQMMPRDRRTGQVIVGQGGEIAVPYGVFKDWRSGLGRQTQTLEAVPGGHLDQIYGSATDAMRQTAARHGVSPAEFDAVQGTTSSLIGSGGPAQYFEKIAGKEGTSGERVGAMPPERAFNRVVDEQNPQGLQQLEQHAPAALNRIAGDTLRLRTRETLGQGGTGGTGAPIEGVRGGGARGAANFADWWGSMSPEAKRILGGNQQGTMQNLSELAAAFNYPPRQTGLTRVVEGSGGGLASRFFVANALGKLTQSLGLGETPGYAAGIYGVQPLLHYIQGKVLESEAARRGMSGQRTPFTPPNMADLLAQLTAATTANRPGL
jgi:hypothetical protein